MKAHRKDAAAAPFRSGTAEEVTEATMLLDDLMALEDDQAHLEQEESGKATAAIAEHVVTEAASSTVTAAKTVKRKGTFP
jgi:hypothetical protein